MQLRVAVLLYFTSYRSPLKAFPASLLHSDYGEFRISRRFWIVGNYLNYKDIPLTLMVTRVRICTLHGSATNRHIYLFVNKWVAPSRYMRCLVNAFTYSATKWYIKLSRYIKYRGCQVLYPNWLPSFKSDSNLQTPLYNYRAQPQLAEYITLEFPLSHLYTASMRWVDRCNDPVRFSVFWGTLRELPSFLTPFADSNCVHRLTEIFTSPDYYLSGHIIQMRLPF